VPQQSLRYSAGTADITPRAPVPLAGYSTRSGPWTSVADRLEANALALDDGATRVVLLSLDLLYAGAELRRRLLGRLSGRLDDTALFLAASHTHYAPATSLLLPRLGEVDPAYLDHLTETLAALLGRVLDGPFAEARLRYREGRADATVNRRRLRRPHPEDEWAHPRIARMEPNPRGARDETVRLIEVLGGDGERRALLWNFACHPVSFPDKTAVSADYPGVVRARLRERAGEVPVVFLQGFAGNIRPREILEPRTVRSKLRGLVKGHYWTRFSPEDWARWSGALAAAVEAALAAPPDGEELAGTLSASRFEVPLAEFFEADGENRTVSFHGVRIGHALELVGVSAEPVVEFARELGAIFDSDRQIPVGYIDEVFGYLPTRKMLHEGGYEVSGFLDAFDPPGAPREDAESAFLEALERLAATLAPRNPRVVA